MNLRCNVVVLAVIVRLSVNVSYAGLIHESRAFVAVSGGVDQFQIKTDTSQFFAATQLEENTPRAHEPTEQGSVLLLARAGSRSVGTAIDFHLHTSGFNPDSDFHVAGAGGVAQARFDDNLTLALKPLIGGDPFATAELNGKNLADYAGKLVVRTSASLLTGLESIDGFGTAELISDFLLEFSASVEGGSSETTRLEGPEAFTIPANTFNPLLDHNLYTDKTLLDAGITANQLRDGVLNPLNTPFPTLAISIEIFERFGGRTGGNASAIGQLDASHTMEVMGVIFQNSQGEILPLSQFFTITSDSGSLYPILDSLPGLPEPNAVPEPGTLTLIGLGAIGLVSGAVRRRYRPLSLEI